MDKMKQIIIVLLSLIIIILGLVCNQSTSKFEIKDIRYWFCVLIAQFITVPALLYWINKFTEILK